jgi:hypothetical protein
MLIESTTFINSQTSSYGGAIYFSSSGQFVMAKVCGYGCKSTSTQYQFDHVQVTNSISSKNEIHDSAICYTTQKSYDYETCHRNGKIIVRQTNFSHNSCDEIASIESAPSSNGDSVSSSFSYSTFANSLSVTGSCLFLSSSYSYEIDSCNIISNSSPSSGAINIHGNLYLKNSCILNNSGTYVIRNSGGKSVTLTNCTIDITNKNYGTVQFVSTPKTSFINKLKHIETAFCYAKYDSFESLTVVPDASPCDNIEIILDKYCNKHMTIDVIRAFNYLMIHSFISAEW